MGQGVSETVRKKYNLFAGFFVILMLDCLLIFNEWNRYQEKMEIVTLFLGAEEEELLDTAVSLWKNQETDTAQQSKGQDIGEQYGYLDLRANQFGREFLNHSLILLLISGAVFTGYAMVLWGIQKRAGKQRNAELSELSKILEQFRKRKYEIEGVNLFAEETDLLQQIYGQLADLGEMLKLLEERMELEKEETKSLVTDISHQLKTPVAALKACFEILLSEDLSSQERQEFSERCKKQMAGLENLLNALINISRMETGMIQVKKETADILETVASAVSRVYLKASDKKIAIEMEQVSGRPIPQDEQEMSGQTTPKDAKEISGQSIPQEEKATSGLLLPHDVKWTCEAFINILENAIKYSPGDTTIRIRMQKLTTFLRIEFQDEGIGIPKEEYHKIFKRFYRRQSREVQEQEGSGIGLYLTREILERQGGSIRVTSAYSSGSAEKREFPGSTFIVQLPLRG